MTHNTYLGMFAKHWQPGAVKTRLAETLGEQTAASIYRLFLEHLLRRLQHTLEEREVAFTPESSHAEFSQLLHMLEIANWHLAPQVAGDLGTRMHAFFQRALQISPRVVLVGSDCPTLPLHFFEDAIDLLDQHDVVLGPSDDGGYYLIAARTHVPPIFSDINWSSPQVWQQTTDQLDAAGVPWAALPQWYDIDDANDLERLMGDLSTGKHASAEGNDRLLDQLRDLMT